MKNLQELNPYLNFYNIRYGTVSGVTKMETRVIKEYTGGETSYGETHEVYKLPGNVFILLRIRTDSYGSNEFVHSIKFVQSVTKEITTYE